MRQNLVRNGTIEEFLTTGRIFLVTPTGGAGERWVNAMYPPATLFDSVQEALDETVDGRGDIVYIAPGTYNEEVIVSTSNVSLIGLTTGGFPEAIFASAGAHTPVLTIADNVRNFKAVNLGFEPSISAAAFGIEIGGRDITFEHCKFAGGDGTAGRLGS